MNGQHDDDDDESATDTTPLTAVAAAAAASEPRLSVWSQWLPVACLLLLLLPVCALTGWLLLLLLLEQREQRLVNDVAAFAAAGSDERAVQQAGPASASAAAALDSFASFISQLQHPPQSSCSQPLRALRYRCLSAAVELEHGSERYVGQSLAFLYSALRAALTAAASSRRFELERDGCDAVLAAHSADSSNRTISAEQSHALLCCSWDAYLTPLHSCTAALANTPLLPVPGSAFSGAPAVLYDVRQQCLGQDEQWAALRSRWPNASRHSIVHAVALQLLRPAPAFQSHLSALLPLLPPAASSPLLLHVPTAPVILARPGTRRRIEQRHARTQAVSSYIAVLRHHAAALPASSLLLVTEAQQAVQEVRAALPQLTVTPLLSVLEQYWQREAERSDVRLHHAVAVSALLLAAAVAGDWVGEWSSVLTQLAGLAASSLALAACACWDVNGERWTALCWSTVPHLFTALVGSTCALQCLPPSTRCCPRRPGSRAVASGASRAAVAGAGPAAVRLRRGAAARPGCCRRSSRAAAGATTCPTRTRLCSATVNCTVAEYRLRAGSGCWSAAASSAAVSNVVLLQFSPG